MPRRVRPNSLTTDQATEAHLEAINVDENGRFQDEPAEREGRGAKKARAEQLERLGEALVALKPGQLARVAMPNDLLVAVKEAQRIRDKKAFGGHRRQIQLVGKIMRTLDAEPIAKALEALAVEGTIASEAFQLAERWRTRLLEGSDDELDALCAEQPKMDRTLLRQTVRAAQKERKEQALNYQKPSTNQKKVFRLLRLVFDPRLATDVDVDDDDGTVVGDNERADAISSASATE